MARPAGLEPATLGLEGRCSVRLSYGRDSVPTERRAPLEMVGADGFEPTTLCSQSRCATRLRHAPHEVGDLTSRSDDRQFESCAKSLFSRSLRHVEPRARRMRESGPSSTAQLT